MTPVPPRFDITASQIDDMVQAFYAEIREHEVLGPIFAHHVNDWPKHEAKIARFWRNAILFERGFDGRPQQVHMQRPEVMAEHFPFWLDLFEQVAQGVLPDQTAAAWTALARRIGAGMQMGIAQARASAGAVPDLRLG